MSYTIMYGRQFIKTTRGIIPLALFGDNNVTVFINGREVRERHWSPYVKGRVELTPEQYMSQIQDWCGSVYQEHFMMNGRWVNDAELIAWAKNGIKNALTIEEIRDFCPTQKLSASLYMGVKDSFDSKNELAQTLLTTEALERWIDRAYARMDELKDQMRYIVIDLSFLGREPLRILKKPEPKGEVLLLERNGYITDIADNSYCCSKDISQALVFESAERGRELLRQAGFVVRNLKFVKAENKFKPRDFMIRVSTKTHAGENYITKVSRSKLHFTSRQEYAKRFASEKEADRYIEKLRQRAFPVIEYSVVHA